MNNKFILVFLLLGYSFCSFGQDLFEKTTLSHMPEVTILGKTLYADFNGDGNSDIVYYNNSKLYYCASSQDSYFAPVVVDDSGGGGLKTLAIDIDLDGDLDLCRASGNRLEWFENVDAAFEAVELLYETDEFEYEVEYSTYQNEIFELVQLDIDGDNVDEIITHQLNGMFIHFISGNDPYLVSIKINDLTGGYWPESYYSTHSGEYDLCGYYTYEKWTGSLKAEDLNFDGYKDLVFLSFLGGSFVSDYMASENIHVHYYLGEGEFSDLISIAHPINFEIAISDYNQDGTKDIIDTSNGTVFTSNYDELSLEESSESLPLYLQHEDMQADRFWVADLNNDELDDCVMHSKNHLYLKKNLGNGLFEEHILENASGILHFQLIDIDGDGMLDIVYSTTQGHQYALPDQLGDKYDLHVKMNHGGDIWSEAVTVCKSISSLDEIRLINVAQTELALAIESALRTNPRVSILSPSDSEELWSRSELWEYGNGIPEYVQSVDMDGDGWKDLFFLANDVNQIGWYKNQQGAFSSEPFVISESLPSTISAAVISKVGEMANVYLVTEDGLMLFEQIENANWTQTVLDSDVGSVSIKCADTNQDSIEELVLIEHSGEFVQVLTDESGQGVDYVRSYVYSEQEFLEFNNEGMSLSLENEFPNSLKLVLRELNLASSSPAERAIVKKEWDIPASAGIPLGIFLEDFDNDGLQDVCYTNTQGAGIALVANVYYNSGNYQFEDEPAVYSSLSMSFSNNFNHVPIDFDGDGQMDWIYTDSGMQLVRFDKEASPFHHELMTEYFYVSSLEVFDIDSDGQMEIIGPAKSKFMGTTPSNRPGISIAQLNTNVSPQASIDLSEGCFNNILTNTSLVNFDNAVVLWDFGNGETSTDIHPEFPEYDGGEYIISLEVCSNSMCDTAFESVSIRDIDFSIPLETEVGMRTIFEDKSTGVDSWSWGFGDGSDWGRDRVSEHVFLEPGEYLIELYQTDTQTTNCTNYHSQMITVHKSSLREPVLFPNPVQDVLSVTIPFEVEESNYTIYNASGQLMMTGNLAAGFNTLNLGRFEVGFYVIDCHIEGESHREKFVIK